MPRCMCTSLVDNNAVALWRPVAPWRRRLGVPVTPLCHHDDVLETLAAGINELRDIDPARLTGTMLNELILEAEQHLTRLQAAVTDKVQAWRERGAWQADRAKSPAAWLTWQTGKPITETRRRIRHAEALPHMP